MDAHRLGRNRRRIAVNIVLPKTLAEPLTIPWFVPVPYDADLERRIKDRLTACFEAINGQFNPIDKTCVVDGQLHTSVRGLLVVLRETAENMGALRVTATSDKTTHRGKHIGNTYIVLFRVPHDIKEHIWGGVSWFDKKLKAG